MIVRIPKYEVEYKNAIDLGIIFIATEVLVAMEYISVYKKDGNKWNFRRLFWYAFFSIPLSLMLFIYTIAALKFICH